MVKETTLLLIVKKLTINTLYDIMRFPVWWYSRGLKRIFFNVQNTIKDGNEILGVSLWFKNLLTPMYGQFDIAGRLISFFIRIFVAIFRLVIFILWILLSISVLIFWITIPVLAISQIIYQLGGRFFL